jgi:hypothetical protein
MTDAATATAGAGAPLVVAVSDIGYTAQVPGLPVIGAGPWPTSPHGCRRHQGPTSLP